MSCDTYPGFSLKSPNFELEFIAGFRRGIGSQIVEYATNWFDVMDAVLAVVEKFPTSVPVAETVLAGVLENNEVLDEGNGTVVEMEEKVYFTPPQGAKKSLKIRFGDRWETELHFHLRKKNCMRMLVDLSAVAVVDSIQNEDDLALLEVPGTLLTNLVRAVHDDWCARYYRNHVKQTEEDEHFCYYCYPDVCLCR